MADNSRAYSVEPSPVAPRWTLLGWLAAFTAAFALYAATASRGAQWQDSGTHIYRMLSGELINPLGLALSHPLHQWLGRFAAWLYPAGPAYAITLVSVAAAAITVANTFGCVRYLTRSIAGAVFAAASLALAHTFWQMATVAEAYSLVTATLSGEIWCVVAYARSRRGIYLWLAFALNGLGLANHNAALLTAPILASILLPDVLQRRLPARYLALCAATWIVGSLPYTWLVAGALRESDQWFDVIRSALYGHSYSEEVLNLSVSPRRLLISGCFMALNFPNLGIPLAVLGIGAVRKQPALARWMLYATFAIHFLFVIRYPVVDQHTFFLPAYLLLAIFAGFGFARVLGSASSRAKLVAWMAIVLLAATPVLYVFVPSLARRFDVLSAYARNKPFRDDYVYVFTPWSIADRSAEAMARQALELAGDDALIIAPDTMTAPAIWYEARVSGKDRVEFTGDFDVLQIAAAIEHGRTVLCIPQRTDQLPPQISAGRWEGVNDFFVLKPRGTPPADLPEGAP